MQKKVATDSTVDVAIYGDVNMGEFPEVQLWQAKQGSQHSLYNPFS